MKTVSQTRKSQKGRWLRAALLISPVGVPIIRALLERLRQPTLAQKAREQVEKAQTLQDGTYMMRKNTFEHLDELSQESRHKLHEQIERVQEEAKRLRAQARQLNRAQHAEIKKRKKLMEQMARSGHELKQSVVRRGEDFTSAASSQLKSGQQAMLERRGKLVDSLNQYGNQATQNLGDWRDGAAEKLTGWRDMATQNLGGWRDGTSQKLRNQSQQLSQNVMGQRNGAAHMLRKQKQHLSQSASDWQDDTTHQLRKQGQHLVQNMADWKDDAAYMVRKQGQHLVHNLAERRDDATHALRKQGRNVGRNVVERKEDMTHQLRKQGKSLSRNIDEHRGGIWSSLGFLLGVLLAGGLTYWLIKNNISKHDREEEEHIELQEREMLNGANGRPGGEIRYVSQGGTAVATRTNAGPVNKFVGVLSTRHYYPIEHKPEAHDLVFFETEDDARAEGFTEAD